MSEKIHVLAQQLLGKPSVEACELEEIRQLAERYPYFAPAQFLLLQKMKADNHPDYGKQYQKAVLYYHNPIAFEYFMNEERFYTELEFDKSEQETETERERETGTELERGLQGETKLQTPNPKPLAPSRETQPPTPNPKPETLFEPFHTVDYFASQGIKLSQEEISKDKFGQQLKSFTEWLKTMKRIPAKDASMDASTEQKVEHLAEGSVHSPEVVTEAMAEVWAKQGNREKAMEIYNKLSLQNPSKSAYFASLIENLKRSK